LRLLADLALPCGICHHRRSVVCGCLRVLGCPEVAQCYERDHIVVGGGAAHPELIGDIGDPEDRTLWREAAEDCQPSLERL
jgi:hypothetical protein